MPKRRPDKLPKIAAKKIKLSAICHDVDDLFTNENLHTLPSSTRAGQLKVASTKLGKHVKRILIQFRTRDGKKTGSPIDVPVGFDQQKLLLLINTLLNQSTDPLPYSFYYNHALAVQEKEERNKSTKSDDPQSADDLKLSDKEAAKRHHKLTTNSEIATSLRRFIEIHNASHQDTEPELVISTETVLPIVYEPQSLFRVQPVARCTANLPGHTEAILNVSIRADCLQIASGSGDTTIRLWCTQTQMPMHCLKGHRNWVLIVEYSPNGTFLASADADGVLFVWNTEKGKKVQRYPIKAHSKYITGISWEPFHLNGGKCERFCTSSKDKVIKVWNSRTRRVEFSFSGHTDVVTGCKWGGEGYIYSSSRDRTIRVWRTDNRTCLRILQGHAHWVNHFSLSTEHALKHGPFDESGGLAAETVEGQVAAARERFEKCKGTRGELLVSASDDFTLFLWNPLVTDKPVGRMHGHQQLVNHVSFSPDGKLIASASFDKSVRVWDGLTGKFLVRLIGHVQSVYQLSWSADSRMVASASKDSTIKLWNLNFSQTKKSSKLMIVDLPGHADEVYALDWSHNGQYLVSGSKDMMLRIHQP